MRRNRKGIKKINNKFVLGIFFITMFLFGTSYAILHQELTLTGDVGIYLEDEGTDLTITEFNSNIDPIYTQYLFNIIPISGYKVVGITFQNTLSKTIHNWTVEFTSNHNIANKPNDTRLSAYLNPENSYDSITYSNNTVVVKGSDTLAPGETKTVYVFFNVNLLNNNFTFSDQKAYYTPPANSGRNSKALANRFSAPIENKSYDINSTDTIAVQICYDTNMVSENLYSTTMYIFIGNNTGEDITNIKFDVSYKNNNLSSLYSSSINILENNADGASFLSNDVIGNLTCKGYIVTGLRTYGAFNGMEISNISYSKGANNTISNNPHVESDEENKNSDNNLTDNKSETIEITNTNINTNTNSIIENTITQNTIPNTQIDEDTTNNEKNSIINNEKNEDENTVDNNNLIENTTNETILEGN